MTGFVCETQRFLHGQQKHASWSSHHNALRADMFDTLGHLFVVVLHRPTDSGTSEEPMDVVENFSVDRVGRKRPTDSDSSSDSSSEDDEPSKTELTKRQQKRKSASFSTDEDSSSEESEKELNISNDSNKENGSAASKKSKVKRSSSQHVSASTLPAEVSESMEPAKPTGKRRKRNLPESRQP